MGLKLLFRRVFEQNRDGDGGSQPPGPAEGNAARQRARIERMQAISRVADGRRAAEMMDVDGERASGRFQNGEFDDSPEAREAAALREDELARQSREEQEERAREAERLEQQEQARRLQTEGAGEDDGRGSAPSGDDGTGRPSISSDSGEDEKVIDGVRYFRTIVAGTEKWLTAKELRTMAAASGNAEETLQRAQDALRSAAQAELGPKPVPVEVLSKKDLANIILAASVGDEEAVERLASLLESNQGRGVERTQVTQEVAQQIATQRLVDRAEASQADLLGNSTLEPVFRQRMRAFAQAKPNTKIDEAYRIVGDQMRKDFAAMLPTQTGKPPLASKNDRKRTIVNPPQSAGRQPRREDEDREVPVSEEIDAIARSRGQARAHRIRRS